MTGVGVVLYGPPAAGKDTITAVLVALDAQFAHLPVVKAGSGRTASYRMVTDDEFDQRMVTGDFVFAWLPFPPSVRSPQYPRSAGSACSSGSPARPAKRAPAPAIRATSMPA